jgi:hypothetical protein
MSKYIQMLFLIPNYLKTHSFFLIFKPLNPTLITLRFLFTTVCLRTFLFTLLKRTAHLQFTIFADGLEKLLSDV